MRPNEVIRIIVVGECVYIKAYAPVHAHVHKTELVKVGAHMWSVSCISSTRKCILFDEILMNFMHTPLVHHRRNN